MKTNIHPWTDHKGVILDIGPRVTSAKLLLVAGAVPERAFLDEDIVRAVCGKWRKYFPWETQEKLTW